MYLCCFTFRANSAPMFAMNCENFHKCELCLVAACQLSDAPKDINAGGSNHQVGIGLRMFQLWNIIAFNLLNKRDEWFVREGYDGRVYLRGEIEMLKNEKASVRQMDTKACVALECYAGSYEVT